MVWDLGKRGLSLLIYGHRGAPAHFPENTLPSFEEALKSGATALETDIRVSLDGEVVVFHDADARRLAGHRQRVETSNWRDVAEWDLGYAYQTPAGERPFVGKGFRAPRLHELLTSFPDTPLNIDIKDGTDRAIDATLQVLRAAGAEKRVLLTSFHTRVRRRLLEYGYQGPLGFGIGQVLALRFGPKFLLGFVRREGDRIQIPLQQAGVRFADADFISKMHALNVAVDFWTINDPEVALNLKALGADGLVTDDPKLLAQSLQETSLSGE